MHTEGKWCDLIVLYGGMKLHSLYLARVLYPLTCWASWLIHILADVSAEINTNGKTQISSLCRWNLGQCLAQGKFQTRETDGIGGV